MKVRETVREKSSVGVLGAVYSVKSARELREKPRVCCSETAFHARSELIKISPILHINYTLWAC